ncbi:ubiquitin receptor rad23b [Phtheirospermum japonicum]|uniref:Ubiquitin receptor RAD23 n=1 Tax=Phtheirospermum japonicum TaxID=374723 RepID=A0A830D0X0_9LAMI|nr:ubiquitin receptor rad23b [Phtheirospermum japonicum]
MKLNVKTLKGSHFQINVLPNDTIMAVKKSIEGVQGKDNYPCGQQLLIHNGKVLKDETTLAENKVSEDGFLVVMLSKVTSSSRMGKNSSTSVSTSSQPASAHNPTPKPETRPFVAESKSTGSAAVARPANDPAEQIIQQLIDMGGGSWDKETVTRALRAAYNNPERAVDYLYSGIPESADVAVPLTQPAVSSVGAPGRPAPVVPNSSPLNLFPQGTISDAAGAGFGSLGFLRNNPQPMLQELGKSNPSLLRLIQENHQEFLQLINEPVDDSEGDLFDQAEQDMPHAVSVTPAEQEAVERLEAMGFDRALVIEAFLACDRNEELAVNYLLENSGHFED